MNKHYLLDSNSMRLLANAENMVDFSVAVDYNSINKMQVVSNDGVAVIPVTGILKDSADIYDLLFGGATLYSDIIEAIEKANDDESVERIELHIDSPGGTVAGVEDAAIAIAISDKPVTAIVGGMCCSAAYWLASQADEIVATSSTSLVGSVGVAQDYYIFDDEVSIASTNAPAKRPDVKTDEGKALVRRELDAIHDVFVSYVAEGRGTSPNNVNAAYGQGGVLIAKDALQIGMIDRINDYKSRKNAGVTGEAAEYAAENKNEVKIMDKIQFKTENPAAYAEIVAEGVSQERERIAQLSAYVEANASNEKMKQVVAEAVSSGKTVADVMPQIIAAAQASVALDEENAPAVATVKPNTEETKTADLKSQAKKALEAMGVINV